MRRKARAPLFLLTTYVAWINWPYWYEPVLTPLLGNS